MSTPRGSGSLPFAVVDDERFDAHRAERDHPECPERLGAARSGLRAALGDAPTVTVEARRAEDREIERVHPGAFLPRLRSQLATGWGYVDADTFFSPESEDASLRAAGGAAALAQALMRGDARRGVALVRPPGHHAEPDRAMGFCLLNNVAVAARAAQEAGAQRIAIVDWDVHHGNGTQAAFVADPDVLFVSLHEWPLYPGTGDAIETGEGEGVGATANVALPSGSSDATYGEAFRRVVLPLIDRHAPDLILVSAGYDAHARDPLARMELSSEGYRAMSTALCSAADRLSGGRIAFLLEGGYDLDALEASVRATLEAASGERTSALPEDAIGHREQEAIDRTCAALGLSDG